jgi:hypothetical protein
LGEFGRHAVSDVYRDGKVHVMADRCGTCIFRPGNRMSLAPGRVRGMVDETQRESGGHVVCHSTLYREGVGNAVCRGWWDRYAMNDPTFRLAGIMDALVFDELDALDASFP